MHLHFESEFKRKIGRSTISDVNKNRNKIISIDIEIAKNKVRDRGTKNPQLEEALYIHHF